MSIPKLAIMSTLLCGAFACPTLAQPLNIIVITNDGGDTEKRYRQFLQEIYSGYVDLNIRADRYDEKLSDKKKGQLAAADLIIVSRDTEGTQYNGDADFWNDVKVPLLNHNAKLARSDDHRFWDWLEGDVVRCKDCTHLTINDPCDPIFAGLDTSDPELRFYDAPLSFDISDQISAGNGTILASIDGNVAIAWWPAGELSYYDGSDYAPAALRLFFAMPNKTSLFFNRASDQALLMLKNALFSLLPPTLPSGDFDEDGDVDLHDFAILANCWTGPGHTDLHICSSLALAALADSWLVGTDANTPVPDPMTFKLEPQTLSQTALTMTASTALDGQYGVRYFFQCTSANGPDSGWQRGRVFEPNALTPKARYTYRVKARDTSGRRNETEYSAPASTDTFGHFTHIADASAGVALDENRVIVGGDEANFLRVYEWDRPASGPILNVSLNANLNIDPAHPESDVEGASWLGDRIFWITSHGRNRDGKYWISRYQFFATRVTTVGDALTVTVDGNYTHLIDHLIAYDAVYRLGLTAAIGVIGDHIDPSTLPDLAPKVDGLNIEGLTATPDGNAVLIALRNPRVEIEGIQYAIIIPLTNPREVVLQQATPLFDPPLLLDLGGHAVRSMEYSPHLSVYLIIAGSRRSGGDRPLQALYTYDPFTGSVHGLREFPIITPEGLFQFPLSPDVQLLSDDGVLMFDTPEGSTRNKFLPTEQRTFRTHTITP